MGLLISTVVMALVAAPAWKEYPQPELGFVVEFPADPMVSTGNYRTGLVTMATAHIFSVKEDHAVYVATVVDLLDRKDEGAILLGEAESTVSQLGDVTSISTSRVEPGRAAIYGRFLTVNCRRARVTDQLGQNANSV